MRHEDTDKTKRNGEKTMRNKYTGAVISGRGECSWQRWKQCKYRDEWEKGSSLNGNK